MELVFDDLPLRRPQAPRFSRLGRSEAARISSHWRINWAEYWTLASRPLVILREAVCRQFIPRLLESTGWLSTLRRDVAYDAYRLKGDEPFRDELVDGGQKRVHLLLRIDDLDHDRQIG